jgi:hypothetical protein
MMSTRSSMEAILAVESQLERKVADYTRTSREDERRWKRTKEASALRHLPPSFLESSERVTWPTALTLFTGTRFSPTKGRKEGQIRKQGNGRSEPDVVEAASSGSKQKSVEKIAFKFTTPCLGSLLLLFALNLARCNASFPMVSRKFFQVKG